MNYDEVRKELAVETHQLGSAEIEVIEAEDELAEAQEGVRAAKKQIKALRQILRNAGEPYDMEKLKGVG